jgi:transposase
MRGPPRTRKQVVREQASHIQRVQQVLEEANIKLASILSDIMGQSGRAVLKALIEGETNPDQPVKWIDRRVKASPDQRHAALRGRVTDHHRFLLRLHPRQIDGLNDAAAEIDQRVEHDLEPFRAAVRLLCRIPGVSDLSAHVIVSEIGIDMSRFPTAGHLISWAGLCPRNDESAGQRRSTRPRKGAPWLKTTLIPCAVAGSRKKASDPHAPFKRPRQRHGPKKAFCAVAASILTAIYPMLRDGAFYQDLGADYFQKDTPYAQARKLAQRIAPLGFNGSIAPTSEAHAVSV